ncbi:hypothetical protein BDY19DRAFT_528933 [Irpex rosettiformis]|uniref:Uncharacterized protein n=1 Tax=Irpex rosettiformis TaxID=378272 RepID=A0ACB8TRD7_9APHY|nr:hypothetical protein BDY19DRAFT_528933 [Irpex rosettiformis]
MGNSSSTQGDQTASLRSRASRRSRLVLENGEANRMSQAVSFYQTPPGSFDLGRRPMSAISDDIADIKEQLEAKMPNTDSESESVSHTEKPELRWKAGVYSLMNTTGGTCLDLSGADDKSIIGFPGHNRPNQQWRFESLGEGFTIRNLHTKRYLTVEDGVAHEATLTVSAFPVAWKVDVVSEGEQVSIRLLWPNERYAVSLAGSGNGKPCTKVHLENASPNFKWQIWRLLEREDPAIINPEPLLVRQQQYATESAPIESVVITENGENITTTRTTTTSTITTLTVVTKTPRPQVA